MKRLVILIPFLVLWAISSLGSAYGQSSQFTDQQLRNWLKRFPEADADGNGKLTPAEAAAYRKATRSKGGGAAKDNGVAVTNSSGLTFDAGWDAAAFPEHAVSYRSSREIMEIYRQGPVARSRPSGPNAMSFPEPTDGGMRVVGVGHSFMAPAYKTLPRICEAAGFEQPLCLHTGGGVTGSARYKWEQENGIFEFDRKPQPKLLASIANAEWEAMLWGAYFNDRPEFYTCWIEYCMQYNPGMKFYLSDAWPQLYQLEELFGVTEVPSSESFFTDEVMERLGRDNRETYETLVKAIREKTTENVFILPTTDALTLAAKRFNQGKLPGVEGIHKLVGGKERSIWRDKIGHLGPGFDRLEGYVFYATLYGKSPELITESIRFGDASYPSETLDREFRAIAWQAVVDHPLSGVSDDNKNGIADRLE